MSAPQNKLSLALVILDAPLAVIHHQSPIFRRPEN
jgi:hypothetical protein